MSLSRHSSSEALTSSKRGSENDRDIEPEKSSIGEISVRISSRPPTGFSSPASIRRWNQASSPTSHWKDWICRSRRSGTSSGSRIFAKVTRVGAPGKFGLAETAAGAGVARGLVARDEAKMRPSENCALVLAGAGSARYRLLVRPGREVRAERAADAGSDAHRLLSWHSHRQTRVSPEGTPWSGRTPLSARAAGRGQRKEAVYLQMQPPSR